MKEEKRNEVDEERFDHHLSRASFLELFKKEKEREVKVSSASTECHSALD